MHCRKVLLARKLVKKVGQEEVVKLLPREVSNGDGSGESGSDVDVVGTEGGREVAVARAAEDSARRCRSCVSTWISPRDA